MKLLVPTDLVDTAKVARSKVLLYTLALVGQCHMDGLIATADTESESELYELRCYS